MAIPTTKITFKKLAAVAAILGLIAVPSFVHAQGHANFNSGTTANTAAKVSDDNVHMTAATQLQSTVSSSKTDDTSSTAVDENTSVDDSKPATTGSVTTSTGSTVPTTTNTTTTASISFSSAVNTAQAMFTAKTIVRAVLLDSKTSAPVYLVTFSDGSKVVVDGTSGKVTFSYDAATKMTTGTWPFPLQKQGDGDQPELPAVQQNMAAVSQSFNADMSHHDR